MDKVVNDTLTFFQAYFTERDIWTQGMSIPGLWQISRVTWDAKYISDLSETGIIMSTLLYGDQIILIPSDLSCAWVFYNRHDGSMEYIHLFDKDVLEIKCWEAFLVDGAVWVIPNCFKYPIITVDICSYDYEYIFLDKKNEDIYSINTSKCFFENKCIFSLLGGSSAIVEINTETRAVCIHDISLAYNIKSFFVDNDFFYVLPDDGNEIVAFNIENMQKKMVTLPDTSCKEYEIIIEIQNKYILLPVGENPILIYSDETWKRLKYPIDFKGWDRAFFWDFNIDGEKLYLVPCSCNMLLEVNVNTMRIEGRKLKLDVDSTDQLISIEMENIRHRYNNNPLYEENKYSLSAFMKIVDNCIDLS